ncbi:MAG: hypothetical protein CL816_02775 [Coxiellaceae bacterium]|nr:hypothetical protein [Coxiellaceae bacterium]|tara:strand:+ start:6559 stop:7572 length:1014 start_codon:yes stop_codon:yes gene_type:complete
MKKNTFKIYDAQIKPGEKASLALPLPEQYSCSPMYMPVKIINGKKEGPCVVLFAVLRGNEVNGMEIINQLYDQISASELSGTLVAVPVLNVYGLTHFPKVTPSGRAIEDSFPGDPNGHFAERVADIITQNLIKYADFCVEFLTGSLNHEILPQVYCSFDDSTQKNIAKVFQAPVITEIELSKNTLRTTLENLNIPLLVYEAGEALRFDTTAIQIGIDGAKNVMRKMGMLHDELSMDITPVISKDQDWLTAPSSGILHTNVSLGEHVKEGDKLGQLNDPFSNEASVIIKSQHNGVIVGINRAPLIQEGSSIFKIVSFLDNKKAESAIEAWEESKPELD